MVVEQQDQLALLIHALFVMRLVTVHIPSVLPIQI